MNKKSKKPNDVDAARCIDLRVRSKQGQKLHRDDMKFVLDMYEEFHQWYKDTEHTVFVRSAPFGSRIKE